jgi:hypothetical protein
MYFDKIIDKDRPPQWSKVKAIEYALNQGYDWVWWIDIDALIMQFSVKLESIIDNNYDVIFTANKYSYLSNGSSFFKNTQLTVDFLKDCYELKHDCLKNVNINVFDHEQQSMRQLLLNEDKYKNRIKLIDERICNSYCTTKNQSVLNAYPNWNNESNIYKNGDFVIQFCGRNFQERLEIYKEYFDRIKYSSDKLHIIKYNSSHNSNIKSEIIDLQNKNCDVMLISQENIDPEVLCLTNYYIKNKDLFYSNNEHIFKFIKELGYKDVKIN